MKRQIGSSCGSSWRGFLPIALLVTVLFMPASIPGHASAMQKPAGPPLNVTVHLTTAILQSLFQSQLDQKIPGAFSQALKKLVTKLPQNSQNLATQLATALFQPTAHLTQMVTRSDGIATTIRLSLYQDDPYATDSTILLQFSVLNPSTLQISAQSLDGTSGLINGPISTLSLSIGQMQQILTTPGCGDGALALNLNLPAGQSQGTGGGQGTQPATPQNQSTTGMQAYIELPLATLKSLGSNMGSFSLGDGSTVQNIQITIQDDHIVMTADIQKGFLSGTATTTVQLKAENGHLAAQVLKTVGNFLIFSFSLDSYNQQIEQAVNTQLTNVLAGNLNLTDVGFGPNSHVPCAAADSLLLTGTLPQI